jgi:5-methylcytosine-specific restriction protein A
LAWLGRTSPVPWIVGVMLVYSKQGISYRSASNLVMVCRTHHRVLHHAGWEVRLAGGVPEFVPPAWIDPQRRPRAAPRPQVSVEAV